MAKGAAKRRGGGGVQNRPAYARISFMYQAAALLATTRQRQQPAPGLADEPASSTGPEQHAGQAGAAAADGEAAKQQQQLEGMSRRLLSDLRSVSLKNQIRLSPALKRTVCKFCDTLLVEGKSCTSTVENKSRGARKPWADVLVITCGTCGRAKRFPVAAPRQKRRPFRDGGAEEKATVGDTTATAHQQLSSG